MSKSIKNELNLTIESLNDQFKGVGYSGRYKITVDKTLPGEVVTFSYDPKRPPKDRIVLEKLIRRSELRIKPPCPYFQECGGCQLQHVDYPTQLRLKHQYMVEKLKEFPLLQRLEIHPPQGMEINFYYRNKTQLPFQMMDGKVSYGLYRKGTHQVIPIDHCLVENREANLILNLVKNWVQSFHIPLYRERDGQGSLRYVVIRKGQFTNQIMVILIIATPSLPHLEELLQELQQKIPSLKSVIINYNPAGTNAILGKSSRVIWGEPFIEEHLKGSRFKIFPNTFFQINSSQMDHIIDKIRNDAGLKSHQQVLELYCGTGTIGLLIADLVKQLVGVDNNATSVAAAQENMKLNKIQNASFQLLDAETESLKDLPSHFSPEVIMVDPPRKGLSAHLINEIVRMNPELIIYLSCNPVTFFQNISDFIKSGYHCEDIFLYDMFPHTSQIESLAFAYKNS